MSSLVDNAVDTCIDPKWDLRGETDSGGMVFLLLFCLLLFPLVQFIKA